MTAADHDRAEAAKLGVSPEEYRIYNEYYIVSEAIPCFHNAPPNGTPPAKAA